MPRDLRSSKVVFVEGVVTAARIVGLAPGSPAHGQPRSDFPPPVNVPHLGQFPEYGTAAALACEGGH